MENGICHCCLFCENGVQESPQTFLNPEIKIIFPLNMASNDDDRRQWRKQGGVVGAAASKTQVPPKARCGCWVPQPVSKRRPFQIVLPGGKPYCYGLVSSSRFWV